MHRRRPYRRAWPALPTAQRLAAALTTALALSGSVLAQDRAHQPPSLDLAQAFAAAWQQQPELATQAARTQAVEAAQQAARRWTAEPPALEVSANSDRLHADEGSREIAISVALALWRPGERDRAQALADAEREALERSLPAARLRLAGSLRSAWWALQAARLDATLAREREHAAARLAEDVARRVRAGELARADQHQAEMALAEAQAGSADAQATLQAARLALQGLLGGQDLQGLLGGQGLAGDDAIAAATPEALPAAVDTLLVDSQHPLLAELQARRAVAERAAELAARQGSASPELNLGGTRERGAYGERARQSLDIGIRLPLGRDDRAAANLASARAAALETQAQARLERARLDAELAGARSRLAALQQQLSVASRRARLAQELRGFVDKSFRAGESDLPTRLRAELEAVETERQLGRLRIDAAAAISALRQALGLLPA